MGIALILEGFMSSFYHICPTDANFQFGELAVYSYLLHFNFMPGSKPTGNFITTMWIKYFENWNTVADIILLIGLSATDTAFMFIMGGLLLVKIFQNRHPDIHANAFIAFFSFAVIIVLTLLGIVSYFAVILWETFKALIWGFITVGRFLVMSIRFTDINVCIYYNSMVWSWPSQ